MVWEKFQQHTVNPRKKIMENHRAHARAVSLATAEKRLTLLQVLDCVPVWGLTGVRL